MDLGNRISNLRKEKGLTQQELADKLFVTDKIISSLEAKLKPYFMFRNKV